MKIRLEEVNGHDVAIIECHKGEADICSDTDYTFDPPRITVKVRQRKEG